MKDYEVEFELIKNIRNRVFSACIQILFFQIQDSLMRARLKTCLHSDICPSVYGPLIFGPVLRYSKQWHKSAERSDFPRAGVITKVIWPKQFPGQSPKIRYLFWVYGLFFPCLDCSFKLRVCLSAFSCSSVTLPCLIMFCHNS